MSVFPMRKVFLFYPGIRIVNILTKFRSMGKWLQKSSFTRTPGRRWTQSILFSIRLLRTQIQSKKEFHTCHPSQAWENRSNVIFLRMKSHYFVDLLRKQAQDLHARTVNICFRSLKCMCYDDGDDECTFINQCRCNKKMNSIKHRIIWVDDEEAVKFR